MTLLSYFSIFLPPNQILIRVFLEDPLSKFLTLYYQKKDGSLESKTTKSSSSIFSFYLCDLDPGTSYRYFILDQIGYFKTLPCQGKNVKFNMGSCFGYAYQSFTQDSPENGIYPSDKVNFNLLMGDQIYADYYFGDPNSKLLLVRPALNLKEYNTIYQNRFFNIEKINTMIRQSLNVMIPDDHDLFDDWSNFYRSFKYSTQPGSYGFSELQLAANACYTSLVISSPNLVAPPPPIPVISQDEEYILWNVDSPSYQPCVAAGKLAFNQNINPQASYFKFNYGPLIEYFVLNIQSDRTPMKINDNQQILNLISEKQMKWLLKSLKKSTAVVKFIVTSQAFSDTLILPRSPLNPKAQKVSFTQLYDILVYDYYKYLVTLGGAIPSAILDYEALQLDQKYRVFGSTMSQLGAASWMYYDRSNQVKLIPQTRKQRNIIIEYIQKHRISGVIFLSGDLHTSFVSYINSVGFPLIEICSSPNGSGPNTLVVDYIEDNPAQTQFAFATAVKSYMQVETDLGRNKVIVTCVQQDKPSTKIEIDLKKYQQLQNGCSHKNPIKIIG